MVPMAGYAAHLVNVAVNMDIVELPAMPPIADQGAKHLMGHAQAPFCKGKHCCINSHLLQYA